MEQRNLTEEEVDKIDDSFEEADLPERSKLALAYADAFLGAQGAPDSDVTQRIREEFAPEQIAELGIGLALFHGFSKLLIVTGCEPEEMERTVMSAPGSGN